MLQVVIDCVEIIVCHGANIGKRVSGVVIRIIHCAMIGMSIVRFRKQNPEIRERNSVTSIYINASKVYVENVIEGNNAKLVCRRAGSNCKRVVFCLRKNTCVTKVVATPIIIRNYMIDLENMSDQVGLGPKLIATFVGAPGCTRRGYWIRNCSSYRKMSIVRGQNAVLHCLRKIGNIVMIVVISVQILIFGMARNICGTPGLKWNFPDSQRLQH